jgi:hypothetical protein
MTLTAAERGEFLSNGLIVRRGVLGPELTGPAGTLVDAWYNGQFDAGRIAEFTQRTFAPDTDGRGDPRLLDPSVTAVQRHHGPHVPSSQRAQSLRRSPQLVGGGQLRAAGTQAAQRRGVVPAQHAPARRALPYGLLSHDSSRNEHDPRQHDANIAMLA